MVRIITNRMGHSYRVLEPTKLSKPPEDLQISRAQKSWKSYFSLLGNTILMALIVQSSATTLIGLLEFNSAITFGGAICTLPLLALLLSIHKPKLIEVRLVTTNENGMCAHALPEGGSIMTQTPSDMHRFIVRDDSILDTPPSRRIWLIFTSLLILAAIFSVFENNGGTVGSVASYVVGISLVFALFSIPAYAWLSSSSKLIGMPTRLREAESWLFAGMAAGLPAILINSWLTPTLIPSGWAASTGEILTIVLSAPIGEEFFKAIAVACFLPMMRGPKHGFQIGFTVGLGFAISENLLYISSAFAVEGLDGLLFTSLLRGIGSIPGHAVWTSISGTAIGWWVSDSKNRARVLFFVNQFSSTAMTIVETIGIDVDMDGDFSGYDGPEYSMVDALGEAEVPISESGWTISSDGIPSIITSLIPKSNENTYSEGSVTYEKITLDLEHYRAGRQIQMPKSVFFGLLFAIIGHMSWNGLLIFSTLLLEKLHASELIIGLVSIIILLGMIILVLFIAKYSMRGIQSIAFH